MCSGNGPSHRTAVRTSSGISCRYDRCCPTGRAFDEDKTSGISCARSYRTLRDGSFGARFPGTSCQATIGLSLRDRQVRSLRRALIKLAKPLGHRSKTPFNPMDGAIPKPDQHQFKHGLRALPRRIVLAGASTSTFTGRIAHSIPRVNRWRAGVVYPRLGGLSKEINPADARR